MTTATPHETGGGIYTSNGSTKNIKTTKTSITGSKEVKLNHVPAPMNAKPAALAETVKIFVKLRAPRMEDKPVKRLSKGPKT